MKQVLVLVVATLICYFAYQNFFVASAPETAQEENVSIDTDSFTNQLPDIPVSCENHVKNLENAVYGSVSGQVSFAQRSVAYRKLQSCLRDADFTDSQINAVVGGIEKRAKAMNFHTAN
jgi:hypothetical protein